MTDARTAYDSMEPMGMGQIKELHNALMQGSDSVDHEFLRKSQEREEHDRQLLAVPVYDNGLTRDEAYSYLLVANRGAW